MKRERAFSSLLKMGLAIAALAGTGPLCASDVPAQSGAEQRASRSSVVTDTQGGPLHTTDPSKYLYFYYIKGPDAPPSPKDCQPHDPHDKYKLAVFLIKYNRSTPPDEAFAYDLAAKAEANRLPRAACAMDQLELDNPGYLLFVMNEPNHYLKEVHFRFCDHPRRDNHSFFNPFRLRREGDLSAFYRLNLHQGADDHALGDRSEHFHVMFKTDFLDETNYDCDAAHPAMHNENVTNTGP